MTAINNRERGLSVRGKLNTVLGLTINAQLDTTYTILDSDHNKLLTFNNTNPVAVTVPAGLSNDFTCRIAQMGLGPVTLVASGTTIHAFGGELTLDGQFAVATLESIAANTFILSGMLEPGFETPAFFHGLVADRINMLKACIVRASEFGGNAATQTDGVAANRASQWTPSDDREFTFGGSSTPYVTIDSMPVAAPDGTNTARKVIESVANDPHTLHAGFTGDTSPWKIKYRFEVFAKAGERTRIQLEIANSDTAQAPARTAGVRATYDLDNGVIGVAAAVFGSTTISGQPFAFSSPSASIEAYDDGWYKCVLTVFSTDTNDLTIGGPIVCTISLDNGSGAGASSTTYAGDGTSGVYLWSTRLLPVRAYAMSERIFHDDFDSANTIDTDATGVAGFKWYPKFLWPSYQDRGWDSTEDRSIFNTHYTVSGGILTCVEDNSAQNLTLATAAWDGASGYVGQTFRPPAFFETKARWNHPADNFPTAHVGSGRPAFWAFDTAIVLALNFWSLTPSEPEGFPNYTLGVIPTSSGTAAGLFVLNFTYLPNWVKIGQHVTGVGIAGNTRVASKVSGAGGSVTLDKAVVAPGVGTPGNITFEISVENDFYEVKNDHTINDDTNTAFGTLLSMGSTFVMVTSQGLGVGLSTSHDDYSIFHLWQRLWLPATATENGMVASFCNGVYANSSLRQYSNDFTNVDSPPAFDTSGAFVAGDTHDFVLAVGGGSGPINGGTITWPSYHDYVSVYA